MPAVLNCLDEDNVARIGGNDFSFKPRQLKYFHDKGIASALVRVNGDKGFIMAPDELEHLAHLKPEVYDRTVTAEEKTMLERARLEGVEKYCRKLRSLIYNATVSLQKDIDRAGYKYDAKVEATDADLANMEKLAKYQVKKLDRDQARVDRMRELEKQIGPVSGE